MDPRNSLRGRTVTWLLLAIRLSGCRRSITVDDIGRGSRRLAVGSFPPGSVSLLPSAVLFGDHLPAFLGFRRGLLAFPLSASRLAIHRGVKMPFHVSRRVTKIGRFNAKIASSGTRRRDMDQILDEKLEPRLPSFADRLARRQHFNILAPEKSCFGHEANLGIGPLSIKASAPIS